MGGAADAATKERQAIALINQGKLKDAEAIYRELITAGARNHTIYGNLAATCLRQGRHDEAVLLLKKTLQLKPDCPCAHNNLGIALKKQGDLSAAVASYNTALKLNPNYPDALYNLGIALQKQGDLEAAIASHKTAIQLKPNYPYAHYNLGIALQEQGDLDGAIASYNTALQLNPNYPDAHNSLGIAHQQQGDLNAATASYNTAIQLKPNYPEAHNNLGNCLHGRHNLDAAIASFMTAIRLKPNFPEAHNNLGNALNEKGDIDAALASFRTALQLKPNYPNAHNNLGNALMEQGDLGAAAASYKIALQLTPNCPDIHTNLAHCILKTGNYTAGWEEYDWRFRREKPSLPHATPKCPRWEGRNLKDSNQLLLVTEQGLGDTLQFMRYASALRNQGISVSLCAQPKLHSLIKASGLDSSPLTPREANEITQGEWMPLLSIPKVLEVSPDNPVINKPYIKTTEELVDKWASIMRKGQSPIIGINWQGNPNAEKTGLRGRSLSLETFAPIIGGSKMSWLSLQKGFGSEQTKTCSFNDHFINCQDQINDTWDFLETAAIIANCDLVITSDTAVAHLAGGMGKTIWLLLHKIPDWRWGLEGETTFWYPSMRLFRQEERGNWGEVMDRVAEALQEHFWDNTETAQVAPAASRPSKAAPIQDIYAPISLGELIEKIKILQIKTKGHQATSVKAVKKELDALDTTLNNLRFSIDDTLIKHLKEINQALWQIEDTIQDQDRQKNCNNTFIHLAQLACRQNDRHAAIRKEIHPTFDSALADAKLYKEFNREGLLEKETQKPNIPHLWETIAITLEPTGERYLEFKFNNKHLEITPFLALRGTDISKEEATSQGIATEELMATSLLTPGALGCAASHRSIWEKCSNGNKGLLVLEDDCYTHPHIVEFITENLERLMNADICFFGINTDSILRVALPSGLSRLSLFNPKNPSPDWIRAALSKTDIQNLKLHKLEKAFGFCAYFISPMGSQHLSRRIFPLSLKTTEIPLITDKMPAISIDRSGCSIYSQLNALVCEPFLAYTPNINSSTKGYPDSQ
jgi:tetratricopeptide (TPR) repeat protein/GR25 family glycosyltransferase involved in LPS biosynthesis